MPPKLMKGKIKADVNHKDRKMQNSIAQIIEDQTSGYMLIQVKINPST